MDSEVCELGRVPKKGLLCDFHGVLIEGKLSSFELWSESVLGGVRGVAEGDLMFDHLH